MASISREESKRYYTKDKLAAQVLGFVGDDGKGLEGIEAAMDDYLQGPGSEETQLLRRQGHLRWARVP